MPGAARQGDMVLQSAPHCHAPIHPPAPTPTPTPHPALPLSITGMTATTVMINSMPAAVMGSMTAICSLPSCVPNGPGLVSKGSGTVLITKKPAARSGDMAAFSACVAPIPSPTGTIQPPCSATVIIGG